MKDPRYTDLICKRFCRYHKPGKERLKCGTFAFLKDNLSPGELMHISLSIDSGYDLSTDGPLYELVCRRCGFLKDGCGFRGPRPPLDPGRKGGAINREASLPCGGYFIVEKLLKGAGS